MEAVLAARGGYGAMRVLTGIDWEMIRQNPKFFCGFSDITALHLAMEPEANLVTFHGPMVAAFGEARTTTPPVCKRPFRSVVPLGEMPWPFPQEDDGPDHEDEAFPRPVTTRPGVADGRLTGGNLSLIIIHDSYPVGT